MVDYRLVISSRGAVPGIALSGRGSGRSVRDEVVRGQGIGGRRGFGRGSAPWCDRANPHPRWNEVAMTDLWILGPGDMA